MKRLSKLAILTFAEYESLVCRTDDALAHAGDFAEELSRMMKVYEKAEATHRAERKRAFQAGVFHASGGYAKALKDLRAKLRQAQEQVSQYKPFGEFFQPSETLTALLADVYGVSDVDAAADFEVVGNAVAQERRRA
jgi:hypothetical protein